MNETIDQNKLENHVDEPIKKCVVGMALLGFTPIMSCCGFNYEGEKVPKKHLKKAYIYLSYPDLVKNNLGTNLLQISQSSRWKINVLPGDCFVDFYAQTWDGGHPWDDEKCPHFYETFVLGINALEKTLTSLKQYFKPTVEIKDGNHFYTDPLVIKHWQYKPTESWMVTPATFDSL